MKKSWIFFSAEKWEPCECMYSQSHTIRPNKNAQFFPHFHSAIIKLFQLLQEVPENGADLAHLPQLHGPLLPAGVDIRYMYAKLWDFGKHQWNAK